MSRFQKRDHWQNDKIGTEHEGKLKLYFAYSPEKIECSGINPRKYVADFPGFPLIEE